METSPQRLILLQKIIIREERLLADRWTQNSARFWELRRRPFSNFPLSTFNFFLVNTLCYAWRTIIIDILATFVSQLSWLGQLLLLYIEDVSSMEKCGANDSRGKIEKKGFSFIIEHCLPLQRNHLNQLMTSVAFADKYSLFRCGSRKQRITTPIPMFRPKPESIIMWCNLW